MIFAADYCRAGIGVDGLEAAEGGRVASGAGQQRVAHAVERGAALFGESDANGVKAVIQDDGSGGGFAFEDGSGINGHFVEGEAGARGDDRIHLKGYGGGTY